MGWEWRYFKRETNRPALFSEGQVLQDGLHSIGKVTMATKEQLMECTLGANRAEHVHNFFDKDEMIM